MLYQLIPELLAMRMQQSEPVAAKWMGRGAPIVKEETEMTHTTQEYMIHPRCEILSYRLLRSAICFWYFATSSFLHSFHVSNLLNSHPNVLEMADRKSCGGSWSPKA